MLPPTGSNDDDDDDDRYVAIDIEGFLSLAMDGRSREVARS